MVLTVSGDTETEKEGEAIETLRETACHGQARPSPTHTAWVPTRRREGLSRPRLFRVHTCTCVRMHTRVYTTHAAHMHVCAHTGTCVHTYRCICPHTCAEENNIRAGVHTCTQCT